jgi:hypothetical protein
MEGNLPPWVIGNTYPVQIYDDFKQIPRFKQHIPHNLSH